jgi:nicotinamidase/pyrazinamidase
MERFVQNMPRFPNDEDGTIFYPDMAAIGAQAARANLPPAATDQRKIHLLIVDMQVDFCHPAGALYVPGAEEDVKRLIRFIYRHGEHISQITCSLDSHLPLQIFHPAWWADSRGSHPPPFTTISHDDVITGRWTPLFEPDWSANYTRSLQNQGRYELTIWPYHCLIGSSGHGLDSGLLSAILWHSLARGSQPVWWMKGSIPKTEHYSIIQPEIPVPEHPQGTKSRDLLNLLQATDYIFIAGEAKSHCVLETVEDLVEEYADRPDILKRILVLRDCTSSIHHPEIDYEMITERRFADFARKGIMSVRSTDPLPW